MSKKLLPGAVLVVGLVAVALPSASAIPGGLPGRPADRGLVESTRARAFGPCTTNTNNCEANQPESAVCLPNQFGSCQLAVEGVGCGTCTGPFHVTCKSTNSNACNDQALKCCRTGQRCESYTSSTLNRYCLCQNNSQAPPIGLWIVCQ